MDRLIRPTGHAYAKVPRAPAARDEPTSRRMAAVRRSGTKPEQQVQQVLDESGIRYTANDPSLPGSPDFLVADYELAILVHGCFWHRHTGCPAASTPKSNVEYWQAKFADNVARDHRVLRELRSRGLRTMVLWQCETKNHSILKRRIKRRMQ